MPTFPQSFARDGFLSKAKPKFRGCLIGTEGRANTGKSEFGLSGPGPGIFLALDRQHRAMVDNPEPPVTRRDDFLIIPVDLAMAGSSATQAQAAEAFNVFYSSYYMKALNNPDARTVVVDGDSDGFECQMLGEFGKVTQVPQMMRTALNASRRVYVARAVQSNKVVIMTNKVKKQYENVFDGMGKPVMDPQKPSEQKREWMGGYERQGWNDHEYCYEIQLRHLYKPAETVTRRDREVELPQRWGIQILMCKAQRALEGTELWGDDCNVQSLLSLVYPQVEPEEWGY